MKRFPFYLLTLAMVAPLTAAAADLTELRVGLQASLQRGLQRSMINGAVRNLDISTGEVTDYYIAESHTVIVALGDLFVMCAALVDATGTEATVDYYLAPNGRQFTIIQTEINNRAPLKALIDAGKAQRLE